MSYSIHGTSAATAQCRLAASPMIVGPPTCGYTGCRAAWRRAAICMHAVMPPQMVASGWNTLAAPMRAM